MRLLSILALCALASATYVPQPTLESRGNLEARQRPGGPCPAGSSSSTGQCLQCPPNTFSTGGSNPCQPCPAGTTSTSGSPSCVCPAGSYKNPSPQNNGPQCLACPAGQSSPGNSAVCSPCAANTYSASGGTCMSCPPGTSSPAGASSCVTFVCPAGKFPVGNSCENCPAGWYSNSGDPVCTDCPPGTISNPGSATCTSCGGGFIPTPSGSTCSRCPANTYSNGDICSPCPGNPPGSSTCTPQPSGPPRPPKRRAEESCSSKPGHMWCPVMSGRGGTECINVLTQLDSCGGCVGALGEETGYSGRDCSAIPNVNEVKCDRGRCKIMSCQDGYVAGQGTCVKGHNTKLKRSATLHARHETF